MTFPGHSARLPATEASLAASLERARQALGAALGVFERTASPVAITDPSLADNPLIFVNTAFTRLTGFSAADAVGRNCRFLQDPRSDASVVEMLHEAVAAGREVTADILNVRKDGSLFWNRMALSVVRTADGEPDFFIGSLSDVSHEHGRRDVSGAGGVWEWDIKDDRLYADARFAALFGLDANEAFFGLPQAEFFANVHPDDRLRLRLSLVGVRHGSELFAREFRIVQSGTTRWIAARGRVEFDEAGGPARLLGFVADITEQKRIEEQLRIAQTAGGVGSFEYVSGFGTVSVSDQFCRLLGVHVTDSLSLRSVNAVVHPDEAPLIAIGQAAAVLSPYREFRIRRADNGENRWLARRGEVREDTAFGTRFVGVIYDVTEAKLAELQLKSLAETLEVRVAERTRERDQLWNQSRDLFLVANRDGRQQAVNPAWRTALGYGEPDLVGRSFFDLLHPDDVASAKRVFQAASTGRGVHDFDGRLRAKDGQYVWSSWTAVSQGDEIFAIGRDISQRRLLEEQLRQSQKMEAVGQLTGGIAHDFNNMLTGIMGGLDIIRRRVRDGRLDDLDRFLTSATTSAERAAGLTHRLLAFSRRQSLDVRAVDVNALILSIDDLLQRTLGENIGVDLDLGGDLEPATADPNQLESALLNLVINARDAMPDGGMVRISTRSHVVSVVDGNEAGLPPGQYARIAVADTGSGMPAAVLAKAFDPFFTTKPIGQGTGLGLSMIYGFMRQVGGTATIHSVEGQGTTVTLYLPQFAGTAAVAPSASSEPEPAPSARGERVLVVEDDPSVRLLVMEVLRELKYEAQEASDAVVALETLRSGPIDLLITDVGLPGMDGRTLADLATTMRPGLRVLFMTAYAEKAAVRSEFLGPGMAMITKPFTFESFAQEVRKSFGDTL